MLNQLAALDLSRRCRCGGSMETTLGTAHFLYTCVACGRQAQRPFAATRRRISNQPTTVLNRWLWITRPPIDAA